MTPPADHLLIPLPKLLNTPDPILRHKRADHRKRLQLLLVANIPRLALDHLLIATHNPQVIGIRFIQIVNLTGVPVLQGLLVDPVWVVEEAIDVKAAFHEKEVN